MTLPDHDGHASLTIGDSAHDVARLSGAEAVSTLFRYEVTCPIAAEATPATLLGKEAVIALRDAYGGVREVHGIVAEARSTFSDQEHGSLVVVVRPAPFRLTLGRDCRVFQDATVVDIVQSVL